MTKFWTAVLATFAPVGVACAQPPANIVHPAPMAAPGTFVHLTIEGMALQNILAELISARTGHPPARVREALREQYSHESLESLGLSAADMRVLFEQAHATLVDRVAAANLITAEQAARVRELTPGPQLRRAPMPERP